MGKQILDSGNKELIEAVNSKKKSINGAYKELKGESEKLPDKKDVQTELSQIQKRYSDYLGIFENDITNLITKNFYQEDEDITGKVHSELRNCLEKFKSIKTLIENMEEDDLDDNSIVVNRF